MLLASSTAISVAMLRSREPSIREDPIAHRPVQVGDDGYISSAACNACHPAQYETWYGSYHRTMTQVSTPQTVRANFEGTTISGVVEAPIALQRRAGGELWAMFDDPDAPATADARVARIERQVVMLTGSHQQQVYWYRTDRGRVLGQLPAMFLIPEQRWIPRDAPPYDERCPPDECETFENVATDMCMAIPNGAKTPGLNVIQWTCNAGLEQYWVPLVDLRSV